ncbi:MAG: CDP-diacylglycerol--serine O-phosphatidyltransferase [Archaeoglobaceae archaeon]
MKIFREVSLADSLSILNALFGFSALVYAIYDFEKSFTFFYLALIADGLDGFVASKTEKGKLGKELDSLADVVSFAIFPAFIMFIFNEALFAFAALNLAFSLLRLARFNVLNAEHFFGIPTSVNAILITSVIRFEVAFELLAILSIISSILMITDLKYPRLKSQYLAILGISVVLTIFFPIFCLVLLLFAALYTLYPVIVCGRFLLHLKQE